MPLFRSNRRSSVIALWITLVAISTLFSGTASSQPGRVLPPPLLLAPASQTEADRLLRQANQQLEQQQFQAAVRSYEQAVQYQDLQPEQAAEARSGLTKAYLLSGDYAKAIPLLQQQVASARQQGYGKEPVLSNLGLAWFLSGNLLEAEKALREAIAGWEAIRSGGDNDDVARITLFEQQAYTYRLLQKVLVAQKHTDAALELAEQSRARALVELLVQRATGDRRLTSPTLSQLKQIAKAQNSTLVEYSLVGREVRVLGNELEDETELFIWMISPNGAITFRQVKLSVGQLKPLSDLVLKTRENSIGVRGRGIGIVSRTNGSSTSIGTQPELQQLYQLLIQPIADRLPTDPNAHITFIPQGALFLVPFAALQDPAGKYLIQTHTILTAPSIQVLALTQQQRREARMPSDTLVVGNPTMPSIPPEPGQPPEPLPDLPGAETEAKAIAPLLKTQPLIGAQATKTTVLQRLPQEQIIHLATHGLLDLDANLTEFGAPVDPNVRTARQSGVLVTPGAVLIGKGVYIGGVPADIALAREKVVRVEMPGAIALAPSSNSNGFLTAKEILGMRLKAELVVLSACDTGRGRVTGDGVVGLSRAFIAAGVPTVVVSLWSIPDAPTASLMVEFYQNLQRHPDKAQALRQAMLTTLKQYPEPKDWAAFTLIGEP